MTAFQYLSAFRTFGADVLLLALGVTLLTSLLKKTVMKNCSKKLFVFLPFVIGVIVYGVYCAIVARSAAPFTEGLVATLEGGFACGLAGTMYYVIYEQFIRLKTNGSITPISPLYPLLEGYLPDEEREKAANELYEGSKQLNGEELSAYLTERLAALLPDLEQEALSALVKLMEQTLLSLRTS